MAYDLDKSMGQLKVHHRKSDFLPSPGLLFDSKPNSTVACTQKYEPP